MLLHRNQLLEQDTRRIKLRSVLMQELINIINASENCEIVNSIQKDTFEQLDVNVTVKELPQFPAYGIRKVENISIFYCGKDFPVVKCRDDFEVCPHLNVSSNGVKTLCLYDVSFKEVQHSFNAKDFFERINSWFTDTSVNQLHKTDQLPEPFLACSKNLYIYNPKNRLLYRKVVFSENDGWKFIKEIPFNESNGELIFDFPLLIKIHRDDFKKNVINTVPKNLEELIRMLSSVDIIESIIGCISLAWKLKQNAKEYNEYFNQSQSQLLNTKVLISVVYEFVDEQIPYYSKSFKLSTNLKELMKFMGVSIKNNKLVLEKDAYGFKHINLEAYECGEHLYSNFASSLNGEKASENRFFQIGLGTLGGKLAENCLRSGFGKWVYNDSDFFLPHNIARHCLTVDYLFKNKAEAMKHLSESILVDSTVLETKNFDFLDDNNNQEIKTIIEESDYIIDASASVAVERKLSIDLDIDKKCLSAFFNPKGNSLIVLQEDKERKIRLDDLEMQYYSFLCKEKKFFNHLKNGNKTVYSTGCRNQSFSFSNGDSSVFAGLLSKKLKMISECDDAEIIIITIDDMDVETTQVDVCEFLEYNSNSWKIRISKNVIDRMYKIRSASLPNETGGVLIGSYDFKRNICYVVDFIDAPDDSVASPTSFVRGCKGLKENLSHFEEVSVGNIYYIGEWHSHPNNNTSQSNDDKLLFEEIKMWNKYESKPGCMIIVGSSNISIYVE